MSDNDPQAQPESSADDVPNLGRLQQVDLREAWPHEARSFSPWLAERLDTLADAIGIQMELEGREVAVENFSADILARNPTDNSLILIENQLDHADHSHLGQILTYLAGLDVQTTIWIAQDFSEAHLSAIRWLNDHTADPFAFLAVKVQVVRIGNSPLAPVFEVLVRPNNWERRLARAVNASNEISQFRYAFWTHFLNRHPDAKRDGDVGFYSNRWRVLQDCKLVISYYVAKDHVGLFIRGLRGDAGEDVYARLEPHAAELEHELNASFGSPDGYHFFSQTFKADTGDRSQWDELADWLHERLSHYEATIKELAPQMET